MKFMSYALIASTLALTACQSNPPNPRAPGEVTYRDPKAAKSLSTEVSLSDVLTLAEQMSKKLLQDETIADSPTVVRIQLIPVKNNTEERSFNTRLITDRISSTLTKSKKVRFVVESSQMQSALQTQKEQDSSFYKKQAGQVAGNAERAKYTLTGDIRVMSQSNRREIDVSYIFSLQLKDVVTQEVFWSDEVIVSKAAAR